MTQFIRAKAGGAARGFSRLGKALGRFHRSEQGDEGVNKILIIALIVVPIVIVLIAFGNEIKTWFIDAWNSITGKKVDTTTP